MLQSVEAELLACPPRITLAKSGAAPREAAASDVMVTPLARGLAVLDAFAGTDRWLCNHDLVQRTGLPASTISRLLRSLVTLGYLRHDEERRKYRLAAASLTLGYAASANAAIQRAANVEMRKFAEATNSYVLLGTRDRLDVIVLETCVGSKAVLDLRLPASTRMRIATSLMGWVLMAALPELERCYLQSHIERKAGPRWPALRLRMQDKLAQVERQGFGMLLGEWEPELASVAAPVCIPNHPPLVLACVGRSVRMARGRVERELGPRLVATAKALQKQLATSR
jgi:DNA-binding IclR family transcriptional regulator